MIIDIRKVENIKERVMIRNIEVMSDKCNIQKTYASVTRLQNMKRNSNKNTNYKRRRKKIQCKGELDFLVLLGSACNKTCRIECIFN
jgi:hypothetical protein